MPIYEYTCPSCSTDFEKLLRRSDEPVACPSCGEPGPRRRLSSFSFSAPTPSSAPSCSPCSGGACGWN